jgi:hypothetical protein
MRWEQTESSRILTRRLTMSTFLNQQMPNIQGASPSDNAQVDQMKQKTQEQVELSLWAAAQALALNKTKMFHTMSKQISDQQ